MSGGASAQRNKGECSGVRARSAAPQLKCSKSKAESGPQGSGLDNSHILWLSIRSGINLALNQG